MPASKLEEAVSQFLENRSINYVKDYRIPQMPQRVYDFFFLYQERPCLIECDGSQHFTESELFDRIPQSFEKRQEIDRLKTRVAFEYGYYLIRIDYTSIDCIDKCLIAALYSSKKKYTYYSNPILYKYLNEKLQDITIINHCPTLARKLGFIRQ